MIISHKYKFIFIKTVKTAGTSIDVFLSQHCGEGDVVTPIYPYVEPHCARNYNGIWNLFPEILGSKGRSARKTLKDLFKLNKFYNHISASTVRNRVSKKYGTPILSFVLNEILGIRQYLTTI